MDRHVDKYKKRNTIKINNCSTVYLSENILHFCCILCCMEDWWNTSTTLIECWSDTWPSELLRLLAEMARLSAMSVGAVMDYLACWWTLKWGAWGGVVGGGGVRRLFACFPFWSPVQQGIDIASRFKVWHYENVHWWISFAFFCRRFCFVLLLSQYMNTMAIGDKLDEKGGVCSIHRPGNALLIQSGHKQLWWGSWNYSLIVFFFLFII